eukprot:m.242090 g.242090  ORF g.242090 m.242090 type:complete len:114 (-) comp22536_c0_seq3:2834-3175(-)
MIRPAGSLTVNYFLNFFSFNTRSFTGCRRSHAWALLDLHHLRPVFFCPSQKRRRRAGLQLGRVVAEVVVVLLLVVMVVEVAALAFVPAVEVDLCFPHAASAWPVQPAVQRLTS